ncbi:hypothetical protein DERP_010278 [Dermatophagoides pteronyssinus]|uniref:EF-hand domain-containing protein n=1 Tax=Dermatophagoides pteronyssinus TaxID=6956 RepID=A0ABQ8IYX6_DERPT|nr:hypothetical protein DERP_010278 [Dermatophagoides pteronyssinus]
MAHNNHNDDNHHHQPHRQINIDSGKIISSNNKELRQKSLTKLIKSQQQQPKIQLIKKSAPIFRSPNTDSSLLSIGIGTIQQQSSSSSTSSSIHLPPRCDFVARLTPEGYHGDQLLTSTSVYDCIVYVIYCPKHDRIAVTNVKKMGCIWLPFVSLIDNINDNQTTWQQASHNGVAILIGRQDPELDAKEAERLAPKYTMQYLQILRIQVPIKSSSSSSSSSSPTTSPKLMMTTKTITRITQFVHLQSYDHCCEDTMRVNWFKSTEILSRKIDKIWGPEIYTMLHTLDTSSSLLSAKIIEEIPLSYALDLLKQSDTDEYDALKYFNLANNHDIIIKIYGNFIQHCFPSTMMSLESFRSYFIKNCDSSLDKNRLLPLFRSFISSKKSETKQTNKHFNDDFIDFHEFLIGLIVIDPQTSDTLMARIRFIFRYYDYGRKNHLDYMDLMKMFKDIHPDYNNSMINELLDQFRRTLPPPSTSTNNNNMITFENFAESIQKNQSTTLKTKLQLNNLCRMKESLLMRLMKTKNKNNNKKNLTENNNKLERSKSISTKQQQQQQQQKQEQSKKKKSMNKCQRCYQQSSILYRIGSHCVTLNKNGRCIEPKIIWKQYQQHSSSSIQCGNDDDDEDTDDDDDDDDDDDVDLLSFVTNDISTKHSKHLEKSTDLIDYEIKERQCYQYSMDFIFSNTSIANIFIELIQDFYRKIHDNQINVCKSNVENKKILNQQQQQQQKQPSLLSSSTTEKSFGIMTSTDERSIFAKFLNVLCSKLAIMLSHEEKLIKINGPAFVFGNIDGNLDRLIQLNRLYFQSFPIMAENLIFLGNYSSKKFNFGIECLVYLFAMKLIQPNKVHLLRGQNELSTDFLIKTTNNNNNGQKNKCKLSSSSSTTYTSSKTKQILIDDTTTTTTNESLYNECYEKYGKQYGKIIAETLSKIFSLLPIIIIVDECIACVHSGIPLSLSSSSSSSSSTTNKNLEQQFYSMKQQQQQQNDKIIDKKRDDDDHHHMNQITKQASFIIIMNLIITRFPHDDNDSTLKTNKLVSRPKSTTTTTTTTTKMATESSLSKLNRKQFTKILVKQPPSMIMKKDSIKLPPPPPSPPPPSSTLLDKQIKINDAKFHYKKSCSNNNNNDGFMTTIIPKTSSFDKFKKQQQQQHPKQQSPSTSLTSSRSFSCTSIKSNSSITSLKQMKSQQQLKSLSTIMFGKNPPEEISKSMKNDIDLKKIKNINFKIIKDNQMLTFLAKYYHRRPRQRRYPPKINEKTTKQTKINHQLMFDRQEFENFLSINNLEFVIRSNNINNNNENQQDKLNNSGFQTNFDNKCLTILEPKSSVNNNNNNNDSATVVFIDASDRRIRFIRF